MVTERNIQFEIKKPSLQKGAGKRATFKLQKVSFSGNSRSYETVNDERIDVINAQFLAGESTFEQTFQLLKEIRDGLKQELAPKVRPVHNSENLALLNKYWKEDYQYRDVVSPETMRWEMENALEIVGHISLLSASAEELQEVINRNTPGAQKQRRVVSRINTLLKFHGRNISLKKKRKEKKPVSHLSARDFALVLQQISNSTFRLLCSIGFETGMRVGEIFAVTPAHCFENRVYVGNQLDRKKVIRDTKTRRERSLYCTDAGTKYLREWFQLEPSTRLAVRGIKHAEQLKAACKRAFPKSPEKWITFHALRHSYAIHLISKGVSISLVAQSLGNSVSVCQEFYGGFSLTSESIETIKNIMGNAAKSAAGTRKAKLGKYKKRKEGELKNNAG